MNSRMRCCTEPNVALSQPGRCDCRPGAHGKKRDKIRNTRFTRRSRSLTNCFLFLKMPNFSGPRSRNHTEYFTRIASGSFSTKTTHYENSASSDTRPSSSGSRLLRSGFWRKLTFCLGCGLRWNIQRQSPIPSGSVSCAHPTVARQ
jgi:hypothetical protein